MSGAPRFLDSMRERIRVKHYSIRTEETCLQWVKQSLGLSPHVKNMGALVIGTPQPDCDGDWHLLQKMMGHDTLSARQQLNISVIAKSTFRFLPRLLGHDTQFLQNPHGGTGGWEGAGQMLAHMLQIEARHHRQ